MHFLNAILIGLKEVWAHKFRSLLTMFGVVLGVASLVGMSAIIQGMENGMKESMIAMGGADKVLLQRQSVPAYQDHLADQAPGRTLHDVMALRESAPLLKVVSPEMAVEDITLTRGQKSIDPSECVGAWPEVLEMNLHTVAHGRFFTAIDEEKAHAVCVIGTGIRDALFGSPEEAGREIIPLGERIFIGGQPFTIVGLLQHYESEQEAKERELRKRGGKGTGQEAPAGPKRQRGWSRGRGGWAFYRKNMTVYLPLNTAWIRFRVAGDKDGIPDPRLSDIDLKVR
ncbi:MAG: ABC transporter permease, partial [Verrucomicrobiota bacterium]